MNSGISKNVEQQEKKKINIFLNPLKMYLPALSSIVVLMIVGRLLSPGFSSLSNINNLISIATVVAIASFGQMLIIISGKEGIDLSVGSMMSMGAFLGIAIAYYSPFGLWTAVAGLIVIAILIGAINATAIQFLDIPPLIMTLGMASVVNGLVLAITRGHPAGTVPKALLTLGLERLGPVRILLILGLVLVVLAELLLRKTRYGRNLYLVGSNRTAAQLSGINVNFTVYLTYILAAIGGALGGLVLLGWASAPFLKMGEDFTMQSIAAVVIGGTALSGGVGTFLGSYLGSIVLVIISNLLVTVGLNAGVRQLLNGVILLLILTAFSRSPKLRQ